MAKRLFFFGGLVVLGTTAFAILHHELLRSYADASPEVISWWAFLCAAAVVNILLWCDSLLRFQRESVALPPAERLFRRRQLVLSAIYVAVCAFRSALPRAYGRRIVLVDSWLSSIALGRTFATVAEIAFAAQLALALHRLQTQAGATRARRIPYLVVPLLAVANCFSWCGTLTTNFLFPAIEIAIWGITIALCLVGLAMLWPRLQGAWKIIVAVLFVGGAIDILFRVAVDIPMYLHRFRADQAHGRIYFSFVDGWRDCATRWHVTRSIADWAHDRAWMALYFSVTVWFSVLLSRSGFRYPRAHAVSNAPRDRGFRVAAPGDEERQHDE
jgi:hypothetical protein